MEGVDFSQKVVAEGLTYDDVLVIPGLSTVRPRQVKTAARLTRRITLNVPIVSAAMDTVTESRMAIALARAGAAGVIHKNMTVAAQVAEVQAVKRAETGIVRDPVTLPPTATVAAAKAAMLQYSIGGIPVVSDGKPVGIVTDRDLRFEPADDAALSDVMTTELVTVQEGTSPEDAEQLLQKHKIEKLLVVGPDDELTGLITVKDINQRKHHPNAAKDAEGRLLVGAAAGLSADADERIAALVKAGIDFIALDTAHGHTDAVLELVARTKQQYPDLEIMAGNVVTAEATRDLIKAGADAIKVGVGPGSICTTRVVAGVGSPQLSAVMECATEAAKHDVPVIADGGIKQTGDVGKALIGGAETVMLGSMLAGTEESPGETVLYEGRQYKYYRGMGSLGAMQQGSSDRYFQDAEDGIKKLIPEGIEGRVPLKGSVGDVVYQIIGGLKATMAYVGAADIATLREKGTFVRITASGIVESHPHDVTITKESPNYSGKS